MKPLLLALAAALCLSVPGVAAQTYLESTYPADGKVVTEELKTVVLNYEGKIEEGSTFKVLGSDGSEVAMDSIELKEDSLTGTLAYPLSNGSYTVEWNSISEDGQPLSGSFAFTVEMPDASGAGEDGNLETEDMTEEIASDVDSIVDTMKEDSNTDADDEGSFWTLFIITAIIVLILSVVPLYTYKRMLVKRKK